MPTKVLPLGDDATEELFSLFVANEVKKKKNSEVKNRECVKWWLAKVPPTANLQFFPNHHNAQ